MDSTASERERRVMNLVQRAAVLPEDECAEFLDQHCGTDPALRSAVEERLAQARLPPVSRASAPGEREVGSAVGGDELIGRHVGQYRVEAVIGRGGMGVVYRARQESPRRIVALKVLHPGLASPTMLKRFEHEAQTLGQLQHPGIAQIFEAGTFDLGRGEQPFFAMEYVAGLPLTAYADAEGLGTRERLALMVRVCDAVDHAHQKGIVHRDLKPGNILVTDAGSAGGVSQPKVLDFGVARATDSDLHATTLRTDMGRLIGTVPYMSPEQASGEVRSIDTRSDVYALGVICYELLTGSLPYDLRNKPVHEAVRVIREEDPTPLSRMNRTFRGDLRTIVTKALEKEPRRRYGSAAELAADVERYLRDEPIAARPPTTWYQATRFARRHRALVGGVAAVLVVLSVSLAGMTALYVQAEAARGEAAAAHDLAEQEAAEARRAQEAEERQNYWTTIQLAASRIEQGDVGGVAQMLHQTPVHLRGWEWGHLIAQCPLERWSVQAHDGPIADLAVSADGRVLVSASKDGQVRRWALHEDQPPTLEWSAPERGWVTALDMTADGGLIAVVVQNAVQILDGGSGDVLRAQHYGRPIDAICFLADSSELILADWDGNIILRDAVNGAARAQVWVEGQRWNAAARDRQGRLLALASRAGRVELRHLPSLELIAAKNVPATGEGISSVAIDEHQDRLLWGNWRMLEAAPIDSLDEIVQQAASDSPVTAVATSISGAHLLAASGSGLVTLHDNSGANPPQEVHHGASVEQAAFVSDELFLTAGRDGVLRGWPVRKAAPAPPLQGRFFGMRAGHGVSFRSDGRMLAVTGWRQNRVGLLDLTTGETHLIEDPTPAEPMVAFRPGTTELVLSYGDALRVYDTASLPPILETTVQLAAPGHRASFDQRGRLMAFSYEHREFGIFDAERRDLMPHPYQIDDKTEVAICPSGRLLAVLDFHGGDLIVRDLEEDGAIVARFPGDIGDRNNVGLAFDPDGELLAQGGASGTITIWSLRSGHAVARLEGHQDTVASIQFSPDGRRLLSSGLDQHVIVWAWSQERAMLTFRNPNYFALAAAFSPDGRTIANTDAAPELRLRHALPWSHTARPLGFDVLGDARFTPAPPGD